MNRLVRTTAALLGLLLAPSAAIAELRQVDVTVTGLDCVSCARALNAALKKLEGVHSVELSAEKGSVDIRLTAENKITLPQLRRTIRSFGNEPTDAKVTANGKIVERDGKPVLDLLNGSFLVLAAKPKDAPPDAVEVTGVSRADDKNTELLTIGSVKK
jgi:copper chaperone CopZ